MQLDRSHAVCCTQPMHCRGRETRALFFVLSESTTMMQNTRYASHDRAA